MSLLVGMLRFFLVVLLFPSMSFARINPPSYQMIYCHNAADQDLARGLHYEGCRDGYRKISRNKWVELALKYGRFDDKEYQYFKNSTPEKLDSGLEATSTGSAFVINREGLLVTSFHVIANCKQVVVISDVDLYIARRLAGSKEDDLAVLASDLTIRSFVKLRKEPLELGDTIYAFGFPFLIKLRTLNMTQGIVSGEHALGSPSLVQLSTPLQPGNSGGPIITEDGLVAGVVAARLKEGQSIGFGLQGELLRQFLDRHGITYTTAPSVKHFNTKVIAEQSRGFTVPLLCLTEAA